MLMVANAATDKQIDRDPIKQANRCLFRWATHAAFCRGLDAGLAPPQLDAALRPPAQRACPARDCSAHGTASHAHAWASVHPGLARSRWAGSLAAQQAESTTSARVDPRSGCCGQAVSKREGGQGDRVDPRDRRTLTPHASAHRAPMQRGGTDVARTRAFSMAGAWAGPVSRRDVQCRPDAGGEVITYSAAISACEKGQQLEATGRRKASVPSVGGLVGPGIRYDKGGIVARIQCKRRVPLRQDGRCLNDVA